MWRWDHEIVEDGKDGGFDGDGVGGDGMTRGAGSSVRLDGRDAGKQTRGFKATWHPREA